MAYSRPSPAPHRRRAWAAALVITLFSLVSLAPHALARPVEGLPYLTDVQIVGEQPCDTCPPQVCPQRPVVVRVSGEVPGCVRFLGLTVEPRRGFPTPLVFAEFLVDTCGSAPCPDVIVPFTDSVTIAPLPPGQFTLWVESHVRSCPDSAIVRTGARPFAFDVLGTCGDPPPVDSLLRSFLVFRVEPFQHCPLDTLRLEMLTAGCPPCLDFQSLHYDFEGSQFIAEMNWRPGCLEFACIPESLSVPIGPFQAGHHELVVNVFVHVLGTEKPDSVVAFPVNVTFDVPLTCEGCVAPELFAVVGPSGCGVDLAPGGEGAMLLYTRTPVPLGGLQGELLCPPPFHITGVFPPDLPGMHVSWVRDGDVIRWVVFTSGGNTIGPRTSPVLKLALAADSSAAVGTRMQLHAPVTLASDPAGVAVSVCDIAMIRLAGVALCIGSPAEACDVNHDASADVRDLVLMSKCALIDPPPGGTDVCPDCDGSGSWAFSDVLCCAQRVLRLPIPPRDSVGGDGMEVTVEETGRDEVGIDVEVRISGADPLGAAMLRLRYPADRWRAVDMRVMPLTQQGDGVGWFPIVDTDLPGVLQLGGLRLTPDASSEIGFRLRFVPTESPRDGDQLVVEGADLASSDGTAFTLATLPKLELSAPAPVVSKIALGPARPNPFTRTTRFSVSLPQAAHVELTVHDLFGRRVATLMSRDLPAGREDAVWDAGGARDGVYFVRLVVDGRVFTQRVALLRDRR